MYKYDLKPITDQISNLNNISKIEFSNYCYAGTPNGTDSVVSHIYRINKQWTLTEASWLRPKKNNPMWNVADTSSDTAYIGQGGSWTTEGGVTKRLGIGVDNDLVVNTWETYDVTNMFKAFLNGETNNGVIIVHDDYSGHTGRYYASSESKTASLRPKLIVTYSTAIGYVPSAYLQKRLNLTVTNVHVGFTAPFFMSNVGICDSRGKEVFASGPATAGRRYNIPINNLPAGVYYLALNHGVIEVVRFVVTR